MVKQKLLDMARDTLRRKHLSYRTEQVYIHWMRKFILFHGKRHPVWIAPPKRLLGSEVMGKP